jgi:cardiolipin synthase
MTTPYFVPDEALKAAIMSASLRGVEVTLILPAKLDNKIVAAAARAHYAELLDAGIRILHHAYGAGKGRKHEPAPGLLHAKAAVIDDELSMIGSANLDMRSFWINFECTLFVYDRDLARQVRAMQDGYANESTPVTASQWSKRGGWEVLRDNAAQLLGPLL